MWEKFNFKSSQIKNYLSSASKDLVIAGKSDDPDIIFRFSYDALLKLAIAVCAANGLRVKSRRGHHVALIEKLALFLANEEISVIGDEMRAKRNKDLYSGGVLITIKEAADYLSWTRKIFHDAEHLFSPGNKLPL